VLGPDARPDQVFGSFADEELLEKIKRRGEESQAVEDHGFDSLTAA
jgi:hypothetical protein